MPKNSNSRVLLGRISAPSTAGRALFRLDKNEPGGRGARRELQALTGTPAALRCVWRFRIVPTVRYSTNPEGTAESRLLSYPLIGKKQLMEFITSNFQPPEPEEFRRAGLLLAAGWLPQNAQEGTVRRTHGYMRNTQVSTSIWKAMLQIRSFRSSVA
jgi:hypothetical protein